MEKEDRQAYLESYEQAKKKGVPFFPDILFKDAVVSLLVFLILVALAFFRGAPLEAQADPGDTNYTPRPEWYFLFLFQLLKYFPGNLEVIGVVVIPTVAVILLLLLPFLDRSTRRHFLGRPAVTAITVLSGIGIIFLTVQSITEAPPPAAAAAGDTTALLYAENCAVCHGAAIRVPTGTNLHSVIAEGQHEGMPSWSADLTTDEIDALAGFIVSPGGSRLFTENCGACHEVAELVAGDPLELKQALDAGLSFPAHAEIEIPDFALSLSSAERTSLLNFLVAPDGQRLFVTNCSSCHGQAVAYSGEEQELRNIILQGGLHLEMPPWQEMLSESDLDALARYVIDPNAAPDVAPLFEQNCSACHGARVPMAGEVAEARQLIATGGSHETMPVWGEVLTTEQLDALVSYTLTAARGTPLEVGRELFVTNCAACHGEFGEGGANPSRSGDIIAPISSAEYLRTRDDTTLRNIISQGQPNFGMSPFGSSFGGPLDDDQVDAIVGYMRSWEIDPPVELPPEVAQTAISPTGDELYVEICSQCHGAAGQGLIGPALREPEFQTRFTNQELFDAISLGHEATSMIAWGEVLSSDQIQELVAHIRALAEPETEVSEEETPEVIGDSPSFAADVLPIFETSCTFCHGTLGGWDGSNYDAVMNTGNNAPVIIPGDADASLLGQKMLGTQTVGGVMPPAGLLPSAQIQIILDWINAGALDN